MYSYNQIPKKYYCAIYLRLSDDDNNKIESNSISNQRELIFNFLKEHPEIKIIDIYIDDGFTGVNFKRPGFQKMMEDIYNDRINCVIVKDLSRFGRNYLEVGNYLERIFPQYNVRFIAVNDVYDSIVKNPSDRITVPIRNLMNEVNSRDTSIKVISHLKIKMLNGDFIGAFAPYGYKKSGQDRNKLIVDEEAANVVRQIFNLKLDGKSNNAIIENLNSNGILSPAEYKKKLNLNYNSGFKKNKESQWSINTLFSILKNEVYIGNLEQGKTYRLNYKTRVQIPRKKEDWIKKSNTHEAIILKEDFDLVQKLLLIDTRTSSDRDEIYLFSGFLICNKCGNILTRRIVYSGQKKYIYYTCRQNNGKLKCTNMSIREDKLQKIVLKILKIHINILIDISNLLEFVKNIPLKQTEGINIENSINQKKEELKKYQSLKVSLYEDLHKNILDEEEYFYLKEIYNEKENKCSKILELLKKKKENLLLEGEKEHTYFKNFKKYKNFDLLTRKILIMFIDKIVIKSKEEVEIIFQNDDEINKILDKLISFDNSIVPENLEKVYYYGKSESQAN